MPGFPALAAGSLSVLLFLTPSGRAQDTPSVAPSVDSSAMTPPAEAAPGQVDDNNPDNTAAPEPAAAPSPDASATNPDLFRATVKPSDDAHPDVPPQAPLPIIPSASEYVSPLQFVHSGGFNADSLLRGNGIHGGLSIGADYDDNVFLGVKAGFELVARFRGGERGRNAHTALGIESDNHGGTIPLRL